MRMLIVSALLVTLSGCFFNKDISIGQGVTVKRMEKVESDQKVADAKLAERAGKLVVDLQAVVKDGTPIPDGAIDAVTGFITSVEADQKERTDELFDDTYKTKKWALTTIKACGTQPVPELDSMDEQVKLATFEGKVKALDFLKKVAPKIIGVPLPKSLAGSGAPPPEIGHAGGEGSDSPLTALLGGLATLVPAGGLLLRQHLKGKKKQAEQQEESAKWKGGATAAVKALNRLKKNGDHDKVLAATEGKDVPEAEKAASKLVYRDLKVSADV